MVIYKRDYQFNDLLHEAALNYFEYEINELYHCVVIC